MASVFRWLVTWLLSVSLAAAIRNIGKATGFSNYTLGHTEFSPRRIFVMRHGLKEANVKGTVNFGLKLLPEAYAPLLATRNFWKERGAHFDYVYASPFVRTRQTANAMVDADDIDIKLDPGLSENLHPKNGLRGMRWEDLLAKIEEDVKANQESEPLVKMSELKPDEPETSKYSATMARAALFIDRLLAKMPKGTSALLVSHGGPSFGLINYLLTGNIDPYDHTKLADMGSVTELEELPDGAGWRVVGASTPVEAAEDWGIRWADGEAAKGGDTKIL